MISFRKFSNGGLRTRHLDGAAPSDTVYHGGMAYSQEGELYACDLDDPPHYIGGIAVREDGAVYISDEDPDDFVNGLPVTVAGEVCVTTAAPEHFLNGLGFTGRRLSIAAKIAVLTISTTHSAVERGLPLIQEAGTTYLMLDSDASTAGLEDYDLIVCLRNGHTTSPNAGMLAAVRAAVDAGVPVVVLYSLGVSIGNNGTVNMRTSSLRIASHIFVTSDNQTELTITDNEHPITEGLPLDTVTVTQSPANNQLVSLPEDSGTYIGDALATGAGGRVALLAVEEGTEDLDGTPLNARIVSTPFHTSFLFTPIGRQIARQAIRWALGLLGTEAA